VEQEGKDGLAVDVDQAAVYTATNLSAKKSVDLELPTYAVKAKTQVNSIIVADWSKYIEINLSTQTMIAYTAGGVVVNSWSITSGASSKGYATPTGTFLIRNKSGEGGIPGSSGGGVCMPNPPSKTSLCGINYVSYFTGQGHAIHEAWWRSPGAANDFGNPNYRWNGSHGCINATFSAAQFIFYWAPIGTPVIIHY
jgi:lipoprotein-anchoring transpeptidase ErfK/SrfK